MNNNSQKVYDNGSRGHTMCGKSGGTADSEDIIRPEHYIMFRTFFVSQMNGGQYKF